MQDQAIPNPPINPPTSASTAANPSKSTADAALPGADVKSAPSVPKVPTTKPAVKAPAATKPRPSMMPKNDILRRITDKIKASENILVALSRDPSVDELAAAIGLTLYLDGLQKHTTAIYSGQAPDALQFLQPDSTFEDNTDSLQDFIISLNKEKADHLRYKLDGDFVRVYITPYKTLITEDDLEFSRGDYNVELVLAIGVPSAEDLDGALKEYGRIMHDATTVDITCDAPGHFSEIEWSDPGASSVSEMVTKMILAIEGQDATLDKDIATALLAGIVAATGRFSNDRTNSDTMQLASKLMAMGADQQLISSHVMDNDPGIPEPRTDFAIDDEAPEIDKTNLAVHQATPVVADTPTVITPDVPKANVSSAPVENPQQAAINAAAEAAVHDAVATATANAAAAGATGVGMENAPAKDYAKMMAEALAEPLGSAVAQQPVTQTSPTAQRPPMQAQPQVQSVAPAAGQTAAPAVVTQPTPAGIASTPTTTGVTQPTAGATPGPTQKNDVVLPPPPAPNTGNQMMPPVLPEVQVPAGVNIPPAPQGTSPGQPGAQSSAFQIPGQ